MDIEDVLQGECILFCDTLNTLNLVKKLILTEFFCNDHLGLYGNKCKIKRIDLYKYTV